jgi:hypothetical protein
MVDTAVHHALINQSGVLVNTLGNLIQQVAGGPLEQQFSPAYFLVCSLAADKGKNPKEEMTLPKMPPPIPTPQQVASGPPYTTPHPMSGYPCQPPPPPPENPTPLTHGGHHQQMLMPHGQGYRQRQASTSQQFRDESKTHANMQYYAQGNPESYFRPACYQAGGGPPPWYHMASEYREYQGQP